MRYRGNRDIRFSRMRFLVPDGLESCCHRSSSLSSQKSWASKIPTSSIRPAKFCRRSDSTPPHRDAGSL